MREMVRCESSLRASDVNRTSNYIVDTGHSLGTLPERKPGKEQIIINKRRAMAYFYIQILTGAGILLPMVIMEQVSGNPGSLGLPVQPYPPVAMVDMVAAYHCVDGAVQFDAAQFRAAELPVCISFHSISEKIPPKWPTIPVWPQLNIRLRRTIWEPTVSLLQPVCCA